MEKSEEERKKSGGEKSEKKLTSISGEYTPPNLQRMSSEERKAYLDVFFSATSSAMVDNKGRAAVCRSILPLGKFPFWSLLIVFHPG